MELECSEQKWTNVCFVNLSEDGDIDASLETRHSRHSEEVSLGLGKLLYQGLLPLGRIAGEFSDAVDLFLSEPA